jgi:hypothetical protein
MCLQAAVQTSTSEIAVLAALECTLEIWTKRDGAIASSISDAFLAGMEARPREFFQVMARHPKDFEDWLGALPALSFTWYRDPPSPLEARRQALIGFLQVLHGLPEEQDQLRTRLVRRLEQLVPRQVD